MFTYTFQSGFLSLLFSIGSDPLQIWETRTEDGKIVRVKDNEICSPVIELLCRNISTTYIFCPADRSLSLGIKLPIFVMICKNMNKFFSFEIKVKDDSNKDLLLRASNFQYKTRVKPRICTFPLYLDSGWNIVQLNLTDFVKRIYATNFVECCSVQIHGNCRLRRVYFCDRVYQEDELPPEFKLYLPVS